MSQAAVDQVKAYSHPKVKGSARKLLEVIAEQIPEGQAMTPDLRIKQLAALMGYGENAARQGRRTLMSVGVVRIVNGGQGEVSRYELVDLPSARGDDPVLPLIGAASPPRARRPRADVGPDLFESPTSDGPVTGDGQVRSHNIDQKDRSWRRYFDPFDRSTWSVGSVLRSFWAKLVVYFDPFDRSWGRYFDQKDRSTLPLDVDDARARSTYTLKEHTHTAAALNEPPTPVKAKPPPCRYAGTVHAWCSGRVHVPKDLHREFLAKMGRLSGETDVGQEARLIGFYVTTCVELPADQPLTEHDFKFWRRAFAASFGSVAPTRTEPSRRAGPFAPRCAGGHEPPCSTTQACIDRTIADGRAARKQA